MNGQQRRSVLVMVAGLLATMTVGVAPALAANQVQLTGLSFTGSTNPGVTSTVTGACDACVPDALARAFTGDGGSFAFGASVTTTVDQLGWTNPSSVAVAYDDALLRQGQTLNLSDTLTNNTGSVTASGILSGSYGLFRDPTGGSDFAPTGDTSGFSKNVTWTFPCTIPLPGESQRDCTSGAVTTDIADYTLFSVADVAEVDVVLKVVVSLDLSVASDGVMTVRQIEVVGGGPSDAAPLTWVGSSPSTVADAEHLSCTQPAGDEVVYHLTSNGAVSPSESLGTTTALTASAVLSPIIGPDVDLFDLGSFASLTTPSAAISFPISAADTSVTLGTLAPNNVPPVANAGPSPYSGSEGIPIQFNGTASSSICGFPALRWDFSDGGVAFGTQPFHTFAEEGTYGGTLTATDASGLTSTTTFTVNVADAPLTSACAMPPFTTQAYGGPTATFTDASSTGTLSDFSATIDWGDGSSSIGAISGGPGTATYSVTGSHTYATTGFFAVKTAIADLGGSSTKAVCANVLVFAFAPGGGAFVIGDRENTVGSSVNFWGAQWQRNNPTYSRTSVASFKGFAPQPTTPSCGAAWSTDPGNSASPPAGPLPTYMGVIVTGSYSKSGSRISGNTVHIVVVRTDSGYGPNPGHAGTGTVIAEVC
jgi:hypothetical protein